ncbi:MAG: SDR family NAD(P)-dependent oxidoreductase [Chitinophagales bacterium]
MAFKSKYGPWAFVAGASEGLGAAFAEALAIRGLNLILVARRKDKLESLAQKISEKYAVKVQTESLDLSQYESVLTFINSLDQEVGLLVYNAAYAPIGYFSEMDSEHLLKVVDVNVKAPLLLAKLFSKGMLHRKKGGIVLMSSLSGTQGSPKIAAYAASKAFNTILAEGLWNELKKSGVDVIASNAGAIRTPGYQQAQDKEAPGTLDAAKVAEETLSALGKDPGVTPGFTNKIARFLMGRLLPRKMAVSIMEKNTKKLS